MTPVEFVHHGEGPCACGKISNHRWAIYEVSRWMEIGGVYLCSENVLHFVTPKGGAFKTDFYEYLEDRWAAYCMAMIEESR